MGESKPVFDVVITSSSVIERPRDVLLLRLPIIGFSGLSFESQEGNGGVPFEAAREMTVGGGKIITSPVVATPSPLIDCSVASAGLEARPGAD